MKLPSPLSARRRTIFAIVAGFVFLACHGLHAQEAGADGQLEKAKGGLNEQQDAARKGVVVRLRENTDLVFDNKVLRQAARNEEFVVMEIRPELRRVYVSVISSSGVEVAASAAVDSATVIAETPRESAERIVGLVEKSQFAAAAILLELVLPPATELAEVRTAIDEAKRAATAVVIRDRELAKAPAEAARIRKNADVIPVSRDRFTGQDRNAPRREAERKKADQFVSEATKRVEAARGELAERTNKLRGSLRLPVPQIGSVVGATAKGQKKGVETEFLRDDPAFVPAHLDQEDTSPSFSETVAFINQRIAPLHLWLGEKSKKINITQAINSRRIVQFDPADMSADVKLLRTTFGRYTEYKVVASPATSRPKPRMISRGDKPGETEVENIQLFAGDSVEQEKLAKAFRHLLEMLGAANDPF